MTTTGNYAGVCSSSDGEVVYAWLTASRFVLMLAMTRETEDDDQEEEEEEFVVRRKFQAHGERSRQREDEDPFFEEEEEKDDDAFNGRRRMTREGRRRAGRSGSRSGERSQTRRKFELLSIRFRLSGRAFARGTLGVFFSICIYALGSVSLFMYRNNPLSFSSITHH